MADQHTHFLEFPLPDLVATERLGGRIADHLQFGDLVALSGDLGAGKTTLARAILVSLGVAEIVPSPTFVLMQNYQTPALMISHYDLYRLKSARELDELGLEEALELGAALIEWPERAEGRLPANRLTVELSEQPDGRRALLSGSRRWRDILHG